MKQYIPYTLVDTAGQTTAVIDVQVSRDQQPIVAKPLMAKIQNIGQVCFIEKENGLYRLQMMGNELSVNGTLAGGNYLLNKLKERSLNVTTSGLKDIIRITKNTVSFPKSIVVSFSKDFLDFGEICYQFYPEKEQKLDIKLKNILKKLTLNRPAAGVVYYKGNQIRPIIYVKPTNTFVWETCCGSASIAYSIITEKKVIKQLSGEKIKVGINCKTIIYSARCRVLR